MTRDELRKIYTFLKKETGIEGIPSRNLGSKNECLGAIRAVLATSKERYSEEKQKNKKWWQIWKER